jgi:hypothetical protein
MQQSASLHRLLGLVSLHEQSAIMKQVISGQKRAYLGTIIDILHARRARFQRARSKTPAADHQRLDQLADQVSICDELIALAPEDDRNRYAAHLRAVAEEGASAARRARHNPSSDVAA